MSFRVGLIGAGGIAQSHLRAYEKLKSVQEVTVCDLNESALSKAKSFTKVVRCTEHVKELLRDPELDWIDVCLPHHLHKDMVIRALQSGKDVVTEKPIAKTVREADAMIRASQETSNSLYVSMNQLFFPYHQRATELLKEGALGRVFLSVFHIMGNELSTMNDRSHWKGTWDRAGGGVLIDTGYHALYMLLHWFGRPRAVTALAKRIIVGPDNKGDDNTGVLVEFDDMIATLAFSYSITTEAWTEKRFIYGTQRSLHIQDSTVQPLVQYEGGRRRVLMRGNPKADHPHRLSVGAALKEIFTCKRSGRPSLCSPYLAFDALRLAEAAYNSSRTGRRQNLLWE